MSRVELRHLAVVLAVASAVVLAVAIARRSAVPVQHDAVPPDPRESSPERHGSPEDREHR